MNPDQPVSDGRPDADDPSSEKLSRKGLIWFYIVQCAGLVIVAFALLDIGAYGWSLFGIIPFSLGVTAGAFTKLYRSKKLIRGTLITLAIVAGVSILMMVTGGEGAICILMALGVIAGPALVGMIVGYIIRRIHRIYIFVFIVMLNGSFITYDYHDESQVISTARESVIINSSRETIWHVLTHGVQFKPNTNMFFEAGVNYPTSMRLEYNDQRTCFLVCTLSTGNTALKVQHLDSLKSIRFEVPDQIIPMRELSLYDSLDAPHLQGYFKPLIGEFSIEAIDDQQCVLIARTSYTYKITPVFYWKWWSDYLVNTMHRHVLNDIKLLAEENPRDQNR